ncbi:unnamed protein product [Ilex paraguariensis]|uniref:SRP54-type proteins GTP-binding domain-containing protein n=1 Tax=Ilex paraguariensis TaxID=185542 RepID=A0ABC8RRY5_9AQUA
MIYSGKLKSGSEIKDALKRSILGLLTSKGLKLGLQLGFRKPAVIMIVGANGGGKTTSLGKLDRRLKKEGAPRKHVFGSSFSYLARCTIFCQILMAAGDIVSLSLSGLFYREETRRCCWDQSEEAETENKSSCPKQNEHGIK